MAKKEKGVNNTPKKITELMAGKLGFNLEQYDGYSNAYLATMEDYIEGPIWCMNLYSGKVVHHAILEEIAQNGEPQALYIYTGGGIPRPLIDLGQEWQRKTRIHGRCVTQIGRIYSNTRLEPCLRWTNAED